MDGLWLQLFLVLFLVLLNAALAGSELALVTLREGQIKKLEGQSRSGRALARLARDPNRFLATIQIGITLAGFLASATAAVAFAEPLLGLFEPLGRAARPTAIVFVTVILTFFTLVFGELAPKRIALQRAERWGVLAARPLSGLSVVAAPAVWLLGRSTDLVVRLLGGDPTKGKEEVTEEELRDMVAAQPDLSPQERLIIDGAFEFADRSLRQILKPRPEVLAFREDLDSAAALEMVLSSGHSRAPVFSDTIDHVTGVVHLRDLVGGTGAVGTVSQPALFLPETLGALDALRRMQLERQQFAIVLNEYGGTEGIVTIEDLIEELVGEIWDEADPDIQAVERNADGSFTVTGAYPIHDLDELGIDLPGGSYTTVAGLILDRLGRVPEPGQAPTVGGWELEILESTDRIIRRVRISRIGRDSRPSDPSRGTVRQEANERDE